MPHAGPSLVLSWMLPAALLAQERAPVEPQRPHVAYVTSKDGTRIAYERSGEGPPVILVSGALSDRRGAAGLARLLAPKFTVIAYDRRGRGDSGDAKTYAVEREVEDIAALVAAAGGSASLFGASSGAVLALEAADRLAKKVPALALFEPPFLVDESRPPIPKSLFDRIAVAVADDRRGDAVALFMTEGVGVPAAMVEGMKKAPTWRDMEALAHTLPYDGALLDGLTAGEPLPKDRWTGVTSALLVIDGERSPPFARNAAKALAGLLPGCRQHSLPEQDHSAPARAPHVLAPVLEQFFAAPASEPKPEPAPKRGC